MAHIIDSVCYPWKNFCTCASIRAKHMKFSAICRSICWPMILYMSCGIAILHKDVLTVYTCSQWIYAVWLVFTFCMKLTVLYYRQSTQLTLIRLRRCAGWLQSFKQNCYWKLLCSSQYVIWAMSWENLFMPYVNNKGEYQPVRMGSLISAFVVRCIDSICMLAKAKFSIL